MTNEEFNEAMIPLMKFFDAKHFAGRMHLYFQAVEDLPPKNFKWMVRHFLETRELYSPPLPTHFIEEANRQRALLNNGGPGYRSDIYDLQPPGDALEKILAKNNVTSILEIIKKRKQGEGA